MYTFKQKDVQKQLHTSTLEENCENQPGCWVLSTPYTRLYCEMSDMYVKKGHRNETTRPHRRSMNFPPLGRKFC